ncbi:MAG: glycosyltransferase [Anaerolineales bacterium]|nr:glycosyltransferase [Anaerolineales bacterium]
MNKILILSNLFPPSGGPSVQRMTKIVRYLPDFGWEPVVVASSPDEKKAQDEDLLKELPTQLQVFRFPDLIIPEGSNFRFMRALIRAFIQPDYHRIWAQRVLPTTRRLLEDGSFSAIYSTGPAGANWLGWKLKREFGLPWVMDIRDLWTADFTYKPVSFPHAVLDRWYEHAFLTSTDIISCVTEGYPSVLQKLYPDIPTEKYVVIPNGYDEADFHNGDVKTENLFLISYVGSMYDFQVRPRAAGWKKIFEPLTAGGAAVPIRSPESLFYAIRTLLDQIPEAGSHVRLRFVGSFPEVYRKILSEYRLEDFVEVIGYVNHSRAVAEMQEASVLVLIQDGAGSEEVIPGKLYEYLRSGTPVLGMLREGLAARLIRDSSAGEVVQPDDRESAGRLLTEWYRCWKAGKSFSAPDMTFIQQFTRREQARALAELLDQLN